MCVALAIFVRQRAVISKKLDAFPAEEDTVLLLLERVSEAQRMAALVR